MTAPSSAQVQMYIRLVIYWAAGALAAHGIGTSTEWQPIAAFLVTLGNFAWTLYGNRLMAKINELAATGQVAAIVVHDPIVADAAPSNLVTSTVDTTVVKKP